MANFALTFILLEWLLGGLLLGWCYYNNYTSQAVATVFGVVAFVAVGVLIYEMTQLDTCKHEKDRTEKMPIYASSLALACVCLLAIVLSLIRGKLGKRFGTPMPFAEQQHTPSGSVKPRIVELSVKTSP